MRAKSESENKKKKLKKSENKALKNQCACTLRALLTTRAKGYHRSDFSRARRKGDLMAYHPKIPFYNTDRPIKYLEWTNFALTNVVNLIVKWTIDFIFDSVKWIFNRSTIIFDTNNAFRMNLSTFRFIVLPYLTTNKTEEQRWLWWLSRKSTPFHTTSPKF